MEKGNLEIIIKDIETGEELVYDQANYIQAYIIFQENNGDTSLRVCSGGYASIRELSQIYLMTRDDVLNELWGEDLKKVKATSDVINHSQPKRTRRNK